MLHIWVYFYCIQIQSKSKDEKRAAMICGEGKQEWDVSNSFVDPLHPQLEFLIQQFQLRQTCACGYSYSCTLQSIMYPLTDNELESKW